MKRAALIVFGLFLGLVATEIALRATGWLFLRMRQGAQSPLAKRPDQYRILCLGESTTADLLFMGKESYPAQLERILNEHSTGARFTVINGGVPATTTDLILEALPADLERHRPDIVVTMIGTNDGQWVYPGSQIWGTLRVWKLARTLYYKYKWWDPRAAFVYKYGPMIPDVINLTGNAAMERIFEARYAEAQTLLQSILDQDTWPAAKTRVYGMMAVLNWQGGDQEAAEGYYRRFVELERQLPQLRTIGNYRELRRILADRRIPLVAVQYPGMPVDILRRVVEQDPHLTVVDNEEPFLQVTKDRRVGEIYRDLFGGIFGHLTPTGNALLAENVARGISGLMRDRRLGDRDARAGAATHGVVFTSPTAPASAP